MRVNNKKIVSIAVAAACLTSTLAFSACGEKAWSIDTPLSYTATEDKAVSNGGFAVEKGGYVYFVNGTAAYDGDNTFGKVEKGALMRISTENLTAGNYDKAETVVPLLFAAQNFSSGIYIYGDYVYFATPTTDKDLDGNVLSDSLDFKRAKLDGSETMSTPYFRLSKNSAEYRFVEVDGTVYCMYVDGDSLKSYNTATKTETTLVKDSSATFYFDKTNAESDTVYYTLGVQKLIDTDNAAAESYNQLYRVSANATVTVDKEKASYTVKGTNYETTYDFDEEFLKEKNKEAKENKQDAPYDFADYTTYPYVNLGQIVLDGIGASSELQKTQFTNAADYQDALTNGGLTELKGFTYTVQSVENGGVYFTRSKVMSGSNEISALYYLSETTLDNNWNSVGGNTKLNANGNLVSLNTTNASATAVYTVNGGAHEYYYLSDTVLYKANAPKVEANGSYTESYPLELARVASGATLLKIEGDNLYFRDGSNYLYSIDITGENDDYHQLAGDRIEPVQIAAVELNASWYGIEIFDGTLLYNNAQTVNSTSYNYIYAAKLGTAAELEARLENYETVSDYFDNLSDADLTNLFRYYFRTGKTNVYEDVKDLYDEYEQKEFTAFSTRTISENKTATDYTTKFQDKDGFFFDRETYFVNIVGAYTEADEEAIDEGFAATLKTETVEEDEDKGLPGWAIALIIAGSVIVVAAAAAIVVWQVKKAKKEAHDREVTAIRPKKKLDVKDDKSIDVYADEAEKTAEDATEE